MLYCAADSLHASGMPTDIAFPNQIEIKINDEQFQGNLRGVKKKPGTTRPADITSLVRKLPTYTNRLSIAYAATERVSCRLAF